MNMSIILSLKVQYVRIFIQNIQKLAKIINRL